MKKIIALILTAITAATALVGCGGSHTVEEIPPFPVDINGVTIERAPKAVASLSPMLTDILLDLGCYSKIVGYSNGYTMPDLLPQEEEVSSESGFRWFWEKKEEPKEPEPELPKGEIGTILSPDFNAIAEYLPEIIFTTTPISKAQMSKLSEVNIKVIVLPTPTTLEGIKENYIAVSKAVFGQNETLEVIEPLVDKALGYLTYIESMVPSSRKSFLYLAEQKLNSEVMPIIATGGTIENSLLSLIGNNFAEVLADYTVPIEDFEQMDPDLIFYNSSISKQAITDDERFLTKTAVAQDELYPLDNRIFSSLRIGVSKLLSPERITVDLTARIDIVEEIRAIAQELYPTVDFTQPIETEDGEDGEDISSEDVSSEENSSETSSETSSESSSENSSEDSSSEDE